jgi:hypothetical protein
MGWTIECAVSWPHGDGDGAVIRFWWWPWKRIIPEVLDHLAPFVERFPSTLIFILSRYCLIQILAFVGPALLPSSGRRFCLRRAVVFTLVSSQHPVSPAQFFRRFGLRRLRLHHHLHLAAFECVVPPTHPAENPREKAPQKTPSESPTENPIENPLGPGRGGSGERGGRGGGGDLRREDAPGGVKSIEGGANAPTMWICKGSHA